MIQLNGLDSVFKEIVKRGGLLEQWFGKASVKGKIVDKHSKPLQGVQVSLNEEMVEETTWQGTFLFLKVPRGKYHVSLSYEGQTIERFEVFQAKGGHEVNLTLHLDTSSFPPEPGPGPGQRDRAYYVEKYGEERTDEFLRTLEQIDALIQNKGWELSKNFRSNFCSYKSGNKIAFGIKWLNKKEFFVFFKLSEEEALQHGPAFEKYDLHSKSAMYKVEYGTTNVTDWEGLFTEAWLQNKENSTSVAP
jgi:hypothetical protein